MTVHRFLPNSGEKTVKEMLQSLGLETVDELYSDVPSDLQLKRPLMIPRALSEIELEKLLRCKLSKNKSAPDYLCFIGGGCSLHHIPSIIDEILSRGEFYTAYTPYQPEISQGMLQSMFEYQSVICELTGMEVANSSMYDWSSALGEAGRMASRITMRKKIIVAGSVSPERIGVLRTYCEPAGIAVSDAGFSSEGTIDLDRLTKELKTDVAAVYFENPSFFGTMQEHPDQISDIIHSAGALSIVGVDPVSLGVLKPPGEYGADIVVGDGQTIGLYPNFGGPLIGIFAIKDDPKFLRQMPGRLIGLTSSKDGSRRGYAMVLQTREQHIRREQATSNICTNEALFALAVAIYLSAMGPQGIREIGEHIVASSHFALERMKEEGLSVPFFGGFFFGEVSLKTKLDPVSLSRKLLEQGILGGLPLRRFYPGEPELSNVSLFSFSEVHSEQDVETLVLALKNADSK
ncbi:MAG: aminomethyl-transferring glycine dehydrogenase subunit GcvPA [Nitrososphaerales archaeon]